MLEYTVLRVILSFYIVGATLSNVTDRVEESVFEEILHVNKDLSRTTNLFEGDIIVDVGNPQNTYIFAENGDMNELKRNAVRDRYYLWREKTVPYVIDDSLKEEGTPLIEEAMQKIQGKSCVTFKKHEGERNWIKFVNKPGCTSAVGRAFWRSGPQELTLGKGCLSVGTIMHELLHALGFWHEQSRPDRDDFIEIMWENVKPGEEHNFRKYDLHSIDNQEKMYDYGSIMHYGRTAYSKAPDLSTIIPIRDSGERLGQRDHLSNGDIDELNLLYDCKVAAESMTRRSDFYSEWTQFGPCNDRCYKEKQRFCSHKDPETCPGADLYGIETMEMKCPDEECYAPVAGHWGRWSLWSPCSVTCGSGQRTRVRSCNDPAPKYDGEPCPGKEVDTRECKLYACTLGPLDCQFELDECIWNIKDGSYKWQRQKGPTRTRNTGPEQDHTNGAGYYMFTESSYPARMGDVANLTSVELQPVTHGRCMSFWYHMYGIGTGSLCVHVIHEGKDEKFLWSESGNHGNRWKYAEVELTSRTSYEVRFSAVRGRNYHSDIALDDIIFKEGSCK